MTTPASPTPSSPLRLLVFGGAEYIGSHMVEHLLRRGCDVVTFDKLSTGHRDAVLGSAPSRRMAHSTLARQALGWRSARYDLKDIVKHVWKREKKAASQSGYV